jgi:hypothetical protein
VNFEEFNLWWSSETTTKKAGSVAGRLAAARDTAFKAELSAESPMGKMLAAKAAAQEKVSAEQLAAVGGAASMLAPGKAGKVALFPPPLLRPIVARVSLTRQHNIIRWQKWAPRLARGRTP